MFEIGYIPLFLNLTSPLGVVIIDNDLIGCFPEIGEKQHPAKSFQLLYLLTKNRRGSVPHQLKSHFTLNNEDSIFNSIPEDCLIGELDDTYYRCLKADISFFKDSQLPVLLHNFRFNHNNTEFSSLNYEIKLSYREAFHLLSNLCASGCCNFFHGYLQRNQRMTYNKQLLIKEIKENYEYNIDTNFRYAELYNTFLMFSLDYIDFIQSK
ncbi:MAG: hypothetical protein ACTSR1_09210, partial [Candidatus Heimdallarchaeota archaeon]